MKDVIFRYINGKIRPIKVNNTKTSNQYMNEMIRNSAIKIDNSKIIDQNEQTYQLYHGSYSDFNEFDDNMIGSHSLGGLTYGKGHYFLTEKSDVYGPKGYKVKVMLKKPYVVQEEKWSSSLEKLGYDWFDSNRLDPSDFLASKGYDGTIIKEGEKIDEIIVYSNKNKKIQIIEKTNNY